MTLQAVGTIQSLRMSVVIPTSEEARNLPHALSLIRLDVQQVIVFDGRSTDD
jgi:glycosyltransferase involved in cell wall biosynthesis